MQGMPARRRPPNQDSGFDAADMDGHVRQRTAALNAILNSAASAIITTDLQGHITSFNPAAEAMFRLPESQALGRPITDFSNRAETRERGTQAEGTSGLELGAAGVARQADRTYVRADGSRFPGLLSISMLRDTTGQVLGILCIITDTTERQQMEQALRERTAQAESANRAKSAFLAHMSHEIRTPLNAVIGLSQLLERMELPHKALDFVQHISQAGEQLLGLTNDVLDLSRIEAGEMRLEHLPFELQTLLQSVREMSEPQARDKSLRLTLELDAAAPRRLLGDPLRLKQILLNLLGNAIKFTPSGSVTLRVAELQRQGARSRLRFDVVDTGIGIPAEQQQRIFEPFTQAESYTTRRFGGSGLGLAIVRRLVGMMDGSLELHSVPGQGSEFSVTLPLELPPASGA
jgi:PAS domain S-box-containing protein